jgi:methylmalonyl-CoA mutase N-terminal domain/subunit
MRLVTDALEFCDQNLPKWNPISISGYHIREAGSTIEQELAFTFANGIAYIDSAIKNGLDANRIGKQISFFFNSHNGFIEEIAKFRAARKIWATIMKDRFGVTNEKAMMCRFHTQTGGSTLTSEQTDNNVVRTTIQALSAVLGGTQSLHTNSRDEALSLPTDESVKLALRTQQVIAHETNIINHPDPFGGSYLVEELTEKLVAKTFLIIDEIDSMGGSISAIESGWIENEISRSAYEYQKSVDNKKQIVVGVNKYKNETPEKINTFDIDLDSADQQIESLKIYKNNRDNNSVSTRLSELKNLAKSDKNIMPGLIKCIQSQCTLGEMSDALREIFGDHEQ